VIDWPASAREKGGEREASEKVKGELGPLERLERSKHSLRVRS
jgi:hypothetical protein